MNASFDESSRGWTFAAGVAESGYGPTLLVSVQSANTGILRWCLHYIGGNDSGEVGVVPPGSAPDYLHHTGRCGVRSTLTAGGEQKPVVDFYENLIEVVADMDRKQVTFRVGARLDQLVLVQTLPIPYTAIKLACTGWDGTQFQLVQDAFPPQLPIGHPALAPVFQPQAAAPPAAPVQAAVPSAAAHVQAEGLSADRMTVGLAQGSLDVAATPLLFLFLDDVDKPPPSFLDSMKPVIAAGLFPHLERMAKVIHSRAKSSKEHGSLKGDHLCIERIAAIMLYSGEPPKIYDDMNRKCYNKDRSQILPYKEYMLLLLASLKDVKPYGEAQVYRGVTLDLRQEYPKGRTFTWYGFASCTKSIEVLSSPLFCGTTGPRTIFMITLTQGQAREITRYSLHASEDEVLLPPGSTFTVKGVFSPAEDLTLVQVEEVPSEEWILDLSA